MYDTQSDLKDSTLYIPPVGGFESFRDEEHYKGKLKEWGLSSAKEAKKEFLYKDKNSSQTVTIKGYEIYGVQAQFNTIVIEFPNGNLSCIHPSYLKEMQQSGFGKESMITVDEKESGNSESATTSVKGPVQDGSTGRETHAKVPAKEKTTNPKKQKEAKIQLPLDKVHFTAEVKQFTMTYNAFTEENDEVVVLENVQIVQEPPIALGFAWCSHSKTLKKFELSIGDKLEFDGKVAAKKLPKGKDVADEFKVDAAVLYKINNPSKIAKIK